MSESERLYYFDGGGCSCHKCAPCSFCMSLTDEEATAYGNDGFRGLMAVWNKQVEVLEPENQWVTIFDYER